MRDKILVVSGWHYSAAIEGLGKLTRRVSKFMKRPELFKLVLFTGGEDVNPAFYNEESPIGLCQFNASRDLFERAIFNHALRHGVKMAGICRGAQFLAVMSSGKLIHHLNKHAGVYHFFECQKDNVSRLVNSLHHQMIIPSKDSFIVGWSSRRLSKEYYGDKDEKVEWKGPEVEAVLMPKIRACGVQWHPEMMPKSLEGYKFFYEMVKDLLEMRTESLVKKYAGAPDKLKEDFEER